ncbi:restriction endonuclease subunit S [Catenibacterium mitsuokai]|uniref:restriction endonuclease subunit S n=1 Tax=Catenibacterium mitsuokai TaxID=100886 RepID=UPI001C02D141
MKGVTKENIKKYALNEFLTEYKELNTDNKYRPVAVGRYGIRKRESIYSKELAKDYSKNKLIHKGTLTVGMGSKQIDIGILIEDETFAVSPAYHTYEIQGIRCKYLEYCLQSKNIEMFSLYAKRGSRQGKSVDLKRWLTYKIPVYSEKDQIVIEENLNKINYVIELRRKQIDLLDELVKARFVEMFGDPVINDKKWLTVSVENLCDEIYGGGTPSKAHKEYYENGDIPWVSSKDMKTDVLTDSQIKINQLGIENSTARLVPVNSVIMVIRSGILKHTLPVAINAVPITVNQDLKVFIPGNKITPRFLAMQFKMHEKSILFGVRAVTADNIEFNSLKARKMIVPPLELQNQFASFLEEIDKSRSRIQKSLEASQELFDSLMQEYFG